MAGIERPDGVRMVAWRAFLEAHARVTAELGEELERETGLSLGWYDVLVQLSEAEGDRLRMTELAAAVLLSKSGLTRLVDRMCAAGLVERRPDPDDRRGTWVEMTAAGRQRLREAAPVHLRGVEALFGSRVSEEEAGLLAAVLRRVGAKE